mmetsp:Transcript_24362/g.67403  ORF Transcript_24362/g.67403 Transcript_24362/m.67403 type:complete len:207 (+) Transcript_24362:382-1002(+)
MDFSLASRDKLFILSAGPMSFLPSLNPPSSPPITSSSVDNKSTTGALLCLLVLLFVMVLLFNNCWLFSDIPVPAIGSGPRMCADEPSSDGTGGLLFLTTTSSFSPSSSCWFDGDSSGSVSFASRLSLPGLNILFPTLVTNPNTFISCRFAIDRPIITVFRPDPKIDQIPRIGDNLSVYMYCTACVASVGFDLAHGVEACLSLLFGF